MTNSVSTRKSANMTLIKALTYVMFAMFAMTTDSVGVIIPRIITEFNLSMSRQEIANYLAVAVETISRLFTDLQRREVIAVDRRFVKILSLPALQELACNSAQLGSRTA